MEKQVKTPLQKYYYNGWIDLPCNSLDSRMLTSEGIIMVIFLN